MIARAQVVGLGVRADHPEADPDPLVCRQARADRFLPTCGEPTDAHCPRCLACPHEPCDDNCSDYVTSGPCEPYHAPGDCDCVPPITFTAKD